MPLVSIQTNVSLSGPVTDDLLARATEITAKALGKPESVTMATASSDVAMMFGGTGEPTALFEIEGIELSSEPSEELCQALSDLAEELLYVSASRVFVKLANVPRGYWTGNRKVY